MEPVTAQTAQALLPNIKIGTALEHFPNILEETDTPVKHDRLATPQVELLQNWNKSCGFIYHCPHTGAWPRANPVVRAVLAR